MGVILWIMTIVMVVLDLWVLRLLYRQGRQVWVWVYGVFAILTDIVARFVPLIGVVGRQAPMVVMACVCVLLLAGIIKVLLAVGIIADRLAGRGRHTLFRSAGVLALIATGVMAAGIITPMRGIRVERVELCFSNLPKGFEGARIGFFTDMHLGALTAPQKIVKQVVDSLNAEECMLVINGGDLVNIRNSELSDAHKESLRQIAAPVYSVMGNHDLGYYRRDTLEYSVAQSTADFKSAVDSLGWTRLDNRSVWIYSKGDSILLTGIEFERKQADLRHHRSVESVAIDSLMRAVPEGVCYIVARHIPQHWHTIRDTHAGDLTLSGHTHAMQCKIRIGEKEWSPAALLYDEWSGLYRHDNKILYISEGIGFAGIPIRLGTPPSIVIFTLRQCE